jgi:hypothetical protein
MGHDIEHVAKRARSRLKADIAAIVSSPISFGQTSARGQARPNGGWSMNSSAIDVARSRVFFQTRPRPNSSSYPPSLGRDHECSRSEMSINNSFESPS